MKKKGKLLIFFFGNFMFLYFFIFVVYYIFMVMNMIFFEIEF